MVPCQRRAAQVTRQILCDFNTSIRQLYTDSHLDPLRAIRFGGGLDRNAQRVASLCDTEAERDVIAGPSTPLRQLNDFR